ncbi:amino acid transporter [Pseudomonas sp. BIGb0408]|uniref:Amino acid transporter n=1 Tax=Phytopseudomonas flavescens TaxID=29435 RepID=A0A7Y9XKD3_9GAMM|nr:MULTISPECIES: amino acid permease [Pseudomonas]MCW2292439.1 amino acid transporter [Pseudomonas sp. BIGb0408]NYH72990.1 amino acid transporter [Pseudomonas flavescens]
MPVPKKQPTSTLKRAVTGPMLMLFILGDVLGAGVYALVGTIAGEVGGAIWVALLVALGFALLTAGSYAELVTKYPHAGASAVFAAKAYRSPLVSFLVGFCMLAAAVTSAAGLSLAFAGDYLAAFVDISPYIAATIFLIFIALLNARGIKESLSANVVMTMVELSGLLLVIFAAAWFFRTGEADFSRVIEFKAGVSPAFAVLAAALLAFYSFVGFETSANLAEEIRDVRKTYPRALFGALIAAGAIYMAVAIAAAVVMPVENMVNSSAPLLEVVKASGLGIPPQLFAFIALIAVANGALLTMIMASRLAYGMAQQGLLPSALANVLSKRRTPGVAIVITTLVAIALTLTGSLATLAQTVVLLLLFVFISTNLAVLVLRRDKVSTDHFRVPTWVPVLGIASCLLLMSQQDLETWLRAGALLLVGVVVYGITRAGGVKPLNADDYSVVSETEK